MDALTSYSEKALASAKARHAANGQNMFASFSFDRAINRYVIEVMEHVVAVCRTTEEVRAFSVMHNREF